jgi:hypothetical protein
MPGKASAPKPAIASLIPLVVARGTGISNPASLFQFQKVILKVDRVFPVFSSFVKPDQGEVV